ncbi:hypothetical protein [Cupriavidus necator]
MKLQRTSKECAIIFLAALQEGSALSRSHLIERGMLTASEVDRALGALRKVGAIRRSASSVSGKGPGVTYEPTGVPFAVRAYIATPVKRHEFCFEALLEAWAVRLPLQSQGGKSWLDSAVSYASNRFAIEEQCEIEALSNQVERP